MTNPKIIIIVATLNKMTYFSTVDDIASNAYLSQSSVRYLINKHQHLFETKRNKGKHTHYLSDKGKILAEKNVNDYKSYCYSQSIVDEKKYLDMLFKQILIVRFNDLKNPIYL